MMQREKRLVSNWNKRLLELVGLLTNPINKGSYQNCLHGWKVVCIQRLNLWFMELLRAFGRVPICSGRFFKLCNWQRDMVDVRQESSGKVDCYIRFYSVSCLIWSLEEHFEWMFSRGSINQMTIGSEGICELNWKKGISYTWGNLEAQGDC